MNHHSPTTASALIQPYLFFGGRCEEALEFYRSAIGAQVGMSMRFSESPDPPPADMLQPGFENKIMHCEFSVGQSTILASDGCSDDTSFSGFSLALSVASTDEADRVFALLAEGGQVKMPLMQTFWSPRYGMLQDRFGVDWMVMVVAESAATAGE